MKRLVFVGMVALVSACGSPGASPSPPPPSRTPASTPTAESSCGEIVLKQGEDLAVAGASGVACLERALRESRSTTLTVTRPTTEGDPVSTTWLLAADGTLTGDSDMSQDRFADQSADYAVDCGRVTTLPQPLECPPRG